VVVPLPVLVLPLPAVVLPLPAVVLPPPAVDAVLLPEPEPSIAFVNI